MDDVVSTLKSFNHPDFINLFFNRRHILTDGTICIIVTTQKWNLIPTFIRILFNMIIIFPLAKVQLETLTKEIHI